MRTPELRLLIFDPSFQTLRQVVDLPWDGYCSVRSDLEGVAVAGPDQIAVVGR